MLKQSFFIELKIINLVSVNFIQQNPNTYPMHKTLNLALCFFLLLFIGCSPAKNQVQEENVEVSTLAEEIVHQSIKAHGGQADYDNLKSITYQKTILLFDSSGNQESEMVQRHNYTLKPSLIGTIEWVSGGDSIRIAYENGKGTRFVNSIALTDSVYSTGATNAMKSGIYVLFQPFKLLEAKSLTYLGQEQLGGLTVDVVQPEYGSGGNGDIWWYYFDVKTHRLVANMVNHEDHHSMIENLAYDSSTALLFNQHRKSFFVDSNKTVDYLRAEYLYEDFNMILED